MQPSGPDITNKTTWETAGVILVVLAGLYAVVRWPLWWSFERLVMSAIHGRRSDLRATIEEEFATEFSARAETAQQASANQDRLISAHAAIEAHGIAMREIPRMTGVMEEMTKTLSDLRNTLGTVNAHVLSHGNAIGRVEGFLQSGEWDGLTDRRKKGRRGEDPPIDGSLK